MKKFDCRKCDKYTICLEPCEDALRYVNQDEVVFPPMRKGKRCKGDNIMFISDDLDSMVDQELNPEELMILKEEINERLRIQEVKRLWKEKYKGK